MESYKMKIQFFEEENQLIYAIKGGVYLIDFSDEQNPKKVNTSNKTRRKKQKNSEKGNNKTNLATKATKPSKKYSEYSKGIKRNA